MGCLISIGVHLYLTFHYYPIKFGFSVGNSVCNLNAKLDCDAAAASAYSAVFGIPLSAWGVVTNFALLIMVLVGFFEWSENPERWKRWALVLAGGSLAASLVMAVISLTQMQSYCLFCMSLYVLSAIVFFACKGMLREPFLMHFKLDLPEMWSEGKGILSVLIAVPIMAYLLHQTFMQNLGAAEIDTMVREVVQEWQVAPKQNFVAKPSLVMGPAVEQAAMTLVEFADFRCGHCKRASYTLHAFVKSHPDVRFEFYSFPLDGACNEKIGQSSGISCRLAAAVYCAEKENMGWALHERLYDIQEEVNGFATVAELDPMLGQTVTKLGLNWQRLQTCIADPMSMDAIRSQAKQGALVNVLGTPTIFADGKLLMRGNMVPVLQAVRLSVLAGK